MDNHDGAIISSHGVSRWGEEDAENSQSAWGGVLESLPEVGGEHEQRGLVVPAGAARLI